MQTPTPPEGPARLGFAVKVLGQPGLKSHDTRRWQNAPHLRVSLDYLRRILDYLQEQDIHMYRMASGLAPYVTHPDMPQFWGQIDECADELATLGRLARSGRVRLSFHPGQYILLNAPDEGLAERSRADVEAQAAILDAMGLDDEAVVVMHIGGLYGDRVAARERFVRSVARLSPGGRRRLVVENDDLRFSVDDVLWVCQRTGLRAVFDAHHWSCLNPEHMPRADALMACYRTWSGWSARAKIHFSSPRDEGVAGRSSEDAWSARCSAHADYVDAAAFAAFGAEAHAALDGRLPDVMLEAKAKDLALRQLREALYAQWPEVAACFGVTGDREGEC